VADDDQRRAPGQMHDAEAVAVLLRRALDAGDEVGGLRDRAVCGSKWSVARGAQRLGAPVCLCWEIALKTGGALI
jgi:hypothetical protein